MREIYELHFHGNRQEIETEKQRKRELISYFPKTLGTVDETKYVLQDDNKPGAENHYDKMNFAPSPTVISNRSEKSNGQQSKPTTSVPSFENSRKNIDFESWKGNTTFLEPKKENAVTTTAPKSPFDFDSNTNKEKNNPFNNTALQLQGLGAVSSNQLRTTDIKSDSLELGNRKISADTIWNANINANTELNNSDIPPTTKRRLNVHGKPRTKDYETQINKMILNMPIAASNILKQLGVSIDVVDNLYTTTDKGEYQKRNGIYLAKGNKIFIDSKHFDEYTLISEVFHAAQDYLGMTGIGKSNLEFLEHVIKDLYFSQHIIKTGDYKYLKGLSTTDDKDYEYFIRKVFNENGDLDLKYFLLTINSYFDKFQKYYSGSGAYQEPGIENFNYNWEMILDLFGIKYK